MSKLNSRKSEDSRQSSEWKSEILTQSPRCAGGLFLRPTEGEVKVKKRRLQKEQIIKKDVNNGSLFLQFSGQKTRFE